MNETDSPQAGDSPQTVASLDIDAAPSDAWAMRPYPIQGPGQRNVVQIVVKRSVLAAIRSHGLEQTAIEVCGVLVGSGYRDERGPYLYVEAAIRGEHSENQAAQVTFTSATWNHIQDEMERSFSDKRILGWYHTHPGFGIFLSGMDMFIHNNFFNQSDQLALVYDPQSGEDGLFVWRRGEAKKERYVIEEDHESDVADAAASASEPAREMTAGAAASNEEIAKLQRRVNRLEWSLALGLALALLWPIAATWFNLGEWISKTFSLPIPASDAPPVNDRPESDQET